MATVKSTLSENPPISPFQDHTDRAGTMSPAAGMWHVTVYDNYARLETVWRQLEEKGHCTVFQTYDWVSNWYNSTASYGEAEPLVAVVFQEDGKPVWILPLCLCHMNGLKVISFADLGYSDYTAPVLASEAPRSKAAIRVIVKRIIKSLPSCDLIHFQKLTENVGEVPNPLLCLQGVKPFHVSCHGMRLSEPWPDLREKTMQRRLRSTIRQQKKKIKRRGNMTIEYYQSPELLGPAMDKLLTMRDARFEATERPTLLPVWKNFYYNMVTRENKSFRPMLAVLKVAGEQIAACFGISRKDHFYALLPTFSMGKWERFRPGMLLFDAMLTAFSEQKPNGYFDFTVGDEAYKKRFGCESHRLFEWMLPRSMSGLGAYAVWRLKNLLRRYPRMHSLIRKLLNKPEIPEI